MEDLLRGATVRVGIDWADKTHVAMVRIVKTGKVTVETVQQDPEHLHEWVATLGRRADGGRIAIAIEQSRGAVVWPLMAHEMIDIYPINPTQSRDLARAERPSGAHDDRSDASIALKILETHPEWLRRLTPDPATSRQLRLLCEMRRKEVEKRTAITNEITDALKQYYPQALKCGGGMNTRLFIVFFRQFPTFSKVQANLDTLKAFYRANGCRQATVIDARMKLLASSRALTEDSAVIEAYSFLTMQLVAQLEVLNESILAWDQRIEMLWQDHPDRALFESLPGAGAALEPRLASVLGQDRSRWADAESIQKFSGIAPVLIASGRMHVVQRRWKCPTFVRQTFHEFASQSIQGSPWARAFYMNQINRGKGHNTAVRALAFRWIRIIHACWSTNTPYDEARYQQSLKRSGSPLAAMLGL